MIQFCQYPQLYQYLQQNPDQIKNSDIKVNKEYNKYENLNLNDFSNKSSDIENNKMSIADYKALIRENKYLSSFHKKSIYKN